MTIRTILVDDEPLAIQGLELRLEAHDDIEIVDTCVNGREAIRSIKMHKPDLVFLDIQMPGFDGFSVIQGLMDVEPPLFVFVTAYSDHAIRAFEADAADYLMKPVDEARLADTLERIRCRLAEKRSAEEAGRLKEVLAEVSPEAAETLSDESDAPAAVEWGITKTGAPDAWALGFKGAGVVVAGQDTGYQWDHPALKSAYRGWNGSTSSLWNC